jgi:hypothetical protein
MKKFITRFMSVVLLLTTTFSCKNKSHDTTPVTSNDISGQWSFILIPDQVYYDTTLLKGHRGTDFESYSATQDEIFLHQTGSSISGFSGPLKYTGIITGDQVSLKVYDQPQGKFHMETPVEEMVYVSDITLTLNADMTMTGAGTYQNYVLYPYLPLNTYKVKATRLYTTKSSAEGNGVTSVSGWEDEMCKIVSTIASWIISSLTDGIFRPMSGNCWLYHDGGGYYIFGHEGPGSVLPLFTETIYYPYEKSFCQCREYGFNISLGPHTMDYDVLRDVLVNNPPIKEFVSKMGFSSPVAFGIALDQFYAESGEFAISMFYNSNTHSATLYVNTSGKSTFNPATSTLIQNIAKAINPFVSQVYIMSGNNINDSDYLRRSPAFVCNSPVEVVYLFGTSCAEYN